LYLVIQGYFKDSGRKAYEEQKLPKREESRQVIGEIRRGIGATGTPRIFYEDTTRDTPCLHLIKTT
jgi:hypothetical protein